LDAVKGWASVLSRDHRDFNHESGAKWSKHPVSIWEFIQARISLNCDLGGEFRCNGH
jgi:hypothetical protein